MKYIKKGFTLIEMLVVIVIIGILASALVSKLSKAKERANDTARKSHLQSVAGALVSYQVDKGSYPSVAGELNEEDVGDQLIIAGLSDIPTDPDKSRSIDGIGDGSKDGQYLYTSITKDGVEAGGFVLMAGTQTEGGTNWVYDDSLSSSDEEDLGLGNDGDIQHSTDYRQIINCEFNLTREDSTDGPDCEYALTDDALRYLYKQ